MKNEEIKNIEEIENIEDENIEEIENVEDKNEDLENKEENSKRSYKSKYKGDLRGFETFKDAVNYPYTEAFSKLDKGCQTEYKEWLETIKSKEE